MEDITYTDFAKLQIRIGTIIAAEVVPDADKLLKLTVDIGQEPTRQIVSGIREWFPDPAALVGRQAPFLINLEARTIRGLDSQGMILAVDDAGDFALLTPHQPVNAGAVVR
jgi:methionyl-tRNA synthetase